MPASLHPLIMQTDDPIMREILEHFCAHVKAHALRIKRRRRKLKPLVSSRKRRPMQISRS